MRFIKKHIIKLMLSFVSLIFILSICLPSNNIDFFVELYEKDPFHYNLISFNAVIAGFLFSGISILISLISNPSIKRLWDNGYLDNLYHSGVVGIIFNVISIIIGFITTLKIDIIILYPKFIRIWITLELIATLSGLIFFIFCVSELIFCINIIRHSKK